MIPNFVGADVAAWRLAQTPRVEGGAKTVKTNPDAPQIPIRLRALYEGKIVYAPVPYLTREFPYLRLDPEKLKAKGVSFELAATVAGLRRARRADRLRGCRAARFLRRRLRRGHARRAAAPARAPASPTSRRRSSASSASCRRQHADRHHASTRASWSTTTGVPMQATTSPLDYGRDRARADRAPAIPRTRPSGVDWDRVQPDQFDNIPFLSDLRDRMLKRRQQRMMEIDDPAVQAEVEAAFARYEAALVANDVAALDALFLAAPTTIRYGGCREPLRHRGDPRLPPRPFAGRAWRARSSETVITTYGRDCRRRRERCSVATARRARSAGRCRPGCGRRDGWRVAAAHVSIIDEPAVRPGSGGAMLKRTSAEEIRRGLADRIMRGDPRSPARRSTKP